MHCPKCGDSLKEQSGTFLCERGKMELSKSLAQRLYSDFVSCEQPEAFRSFKTGYRFGGRWFCPGCGVLMKEKESGAVTCPQCRRNIGQYLYELVEMHPHAGQ